MVVIPKADIDSADIRQLTTEFIHGDSAVFDSATITTILQSEHLTLILSISGIVQPLLILRYLLH